MFVLLCFLNLLRGRFLLASLMAGAASGCRLVGIALVFPILYALWQNRVDARHFFYRSVWTVPISIWGILCFVVYQWIEFGNPFAFIETQGNWSSLQFDTVQDKLVHAITLGPVRDVFDDATACYWGNVAPHENPLFNMRVMNVLYFIACVWAICEGIRRKWLTREEILFAFCVLGIAYVSQAGRACMMAQGRYCSVVFPQYLVVAGCLAKCHDSVRLAVVAGMAVLLFVNASMFSAWYWYF
ncbi:MAG: hypothetical protein ACR2FY_17200 [Pirellulaceae bacterium]